MRPAYHGATLRSPVRQTGPMRDATEALADWAARVRRNREQAERCRRAGPEGGDFYAPVASWFRADPRREGDAVLDALRALVRADETVLDVGAGGGRYALPLALHARETIAVEPSEGMRAVLREGMAAHGVANVRVVAERWPCADPPAADVALIAHVGYDVEAIGPFLDAMEAAASRLCVAVLFSRPPPSRADPFWEAIHGEPREPLPALPEFLALQRARGRRCETRSVEPARPSGTAWRTRCASCASSSASRRTAPRTRACASCCRATPASARTGASSSRGTRARSASSRGNRGASARRGRTSARA